MVVAAGAGSVVSLLLALGDENELRGMVFWLLGDLSRSGRWAWLLSLLAAGTVIGFAIGGISDVLARGPPPGGERGHGSRRLQGLLFVGSSVLTGAAVSAAGSIGFVGL